MGFLDKILNKPKLTKEEEKAMEIIKSGTKTPLQRKEAVKKINNQKILIDIFENDISPDVRAEAIKKINDEQILKKIALTNRATIDEKIEAVKKINDEKTLKQILKNEEHYLVRQQAVKNLNDETTLANMAKNDTMQHVRLEAIKNPNLTDQKTLIEISKGAEYTLVKTALEKVDDKEKIKDLSIKSINPKIRKEAIKELTDQEIISNVAKNDEIYWVRKEALHKVTDKKILLDSKYPEIRIEAIKELTDDKVLTNIAKNDSEEYVRYEAFKQSSQGNIQILEDEGIKIIHSIKEFTELKKNSKICLDDDLDSIEEIHINQDNIFIDGNHHTITGNNLTKIFEIYGKNITIVNLIFKGSTYDVLNLKSKGGALYIGREASCKLINCKFIDNVKEFGGGAIENKGKTEILNCIFINNTSKRKSKYEKSSGGAIRSSNEIIIKNSYFEGNMADNGGAISAVDKITIEECEFKNNTALTGKGGAISCYKKQFKLKNCYESSNKPKFEYIY